MGFYMMCFKLVGLGQMGTGRDPGAEARSCATLEATVRILALTLNDAGFSAKINMISLNF